jgi:hypothetical protein
MSERKMIRIVSEGQSRDVPVVDLLAIIEEHTERVPIELSGDRGAIVLKRIPDVDVLEICKEFQDLLDENNNDMKRGNQIRDIPKTERTEEDIAFLVELGKKLRPYTIALVHAMLDEPKGYSCDQVDKFLWALPEQDQVNIFDKMGKLQQPRTIDPKD